MSRPSTLHGAAACGDVALLRKLLAKGADVDGVDADGNSPLLLATHYGRLAAVQVLLDARADVNKAGKDGYTPLFVAAQEGRVMVVVALLRAGAEKDEARDDGGARLCSLPLKTGAETLSRRCCEPGRTRTRRATTAPLL